MSGLTVPQCGLLLTAAYTQETTLKPCLEMSGMDAIVARKHDDVNHKLPR
jgi:hypothetical protein